MVFPKHSWGDGSFRFFCYVLLGVRAHATGTLQRRSFCRNTGTARTRLQFWGSHARDGTTGGTVPQGICYEWTGLSYQERMSGSQATSLFVLSVLVVFLCLAALYESVSVPFAVILVVPGILGALGAASLRGLSNDVYFQVGLLATMGLSAKNAILIVEFAKALHDGGKGLIASSVEAARMRLRPILMTSLAFLLGILPLAISSGAGAGGQNAIGTGVLGGTLAATILGIFFIPLFFVVITRLFSKRKQ